MKHFIYSLVLMGLGFCAHAEKYSSYYYEVKSNGSIAITNTVSSLKGVVKIPSTIDGKTVTEIGKDAFAAHPGITSVTIPSGVKEIGKDAFKDCSNLTTFSFANLRAKVRLGETFLQDTAVTSVTLPQEAELDDKDCKVLYDSDLTTVSFTGLVPPTFLDDNLNATNSTGKLKVKINKIVIPAAADLSLWKTLLPKYLARKGVISRSNPRVWIDSAEGGAVTVMSGTRRLTNGSTIAKGSKVTVTCTAKTGYVFSRSLYQGAVSLAAKRTLTVPAADMTFGAKFVTAEEEQQGFNTAVKAMRTLGVLNADTALSSGTITVGDTEYNCVFGQAGQVVESKLSGTDNLLSPITFTLTGLPTGLSVVYSAGAYHLVGVPTASLDFATAPAYVKMSTVSGLSALFRINLQVTDYDVVAVKQSCPVGETTAIAAADLPDLTAFADYTTTNAPAGFVWDLASETPITFTPTAPALRKIALVRPAEALAKTYEERKYVEILATGVTSNHVNAAFAKVPAERTSPAGTKLSLNVKSWFSDGKTSAKVSGLPTGLKFNLSALSISGTPTKAGTYTVTLTKTVSRKSVVQRFLWTITGTHADFSFAENQDKLNLDFVAANNHATLIAGTPGSRLATSLIPDDPQAKVSVSGLPTGLTLVKKADGSYGFAGRATKPGTYVVTFAVTAPGGEVQRRRIEYTVVSHPLKGSYRGYVATPGVGIGSTVMTVDELGRGTLTLTEGSLKTVVKNVYATTSDWSGDEAPSDGLFAYAFKLPANSSRKLPTRTCRLAYETVKSTNFLEKVAVSDTNLCAIVSSGKGATTELCCLPYLTTAQIADADFNPNGDAVAASYGLGFTYTNGTKQAGFYLTGVGTPTSRSVKLAGRLPAGKTFSASTVAVDYGSATLAYAPVILKDTDGKYYKLVVPLNEANFGKGPATVQVWNGATFADCEGASYQVRPETLAASVKLFVEALTGGDKALLNSSLLSQLADFSVAGKVKVPSATAASVSYNRTSGLVKFTLVIKKQTYTFEGVVLCEGESAGIRGILSRTSDGKKFVYAPAAIVKPE